MFSFLIVDKHNVTSKGFDFVIKKLYPQAVVYRARSIREAEDVLANGLVTAMLINLETLAGDHYEFCVSAKKKQPDLIIIAHIVERANLTSAKRVRIPSRCFIDTREEDLEQVEKAIIDALDGKFYMSNSLREELADAVIRPNGAALIQSLSNRERQVAVQLIEGKDVSQIADKLRLKLNSVVSYKYRIFEKLHLPKNDFSELHIFFERYGMYLFKS